MDSGIGLLPEARLYKLDDLIAVARRKAVPIASTEFRKLKRDASTPLPTQSEGGLDGDAPEPAPAPFDLTAAGPGYPASSAQIARTASHRIL
jgi:hypothetical protein